MRKSVLDALFSKTRQNVLSSFLLHPDKWWYLSDLANHLTVTPSSLQRELASLTDVNLLESRKEGNRTYYKVNLLCPGVHELQSLMIKTAGIIDVLKLALKSFLKDIDFSFIYGSLARAEAIATSDVDIMIIGNVKLASIASALKKTEKLLGREINVTIYSGREFAHKIKINDSYITTVLEDKKIFLKGNDRELKAMAR